MYVVLTTILSVLYQLGSASESCSERMLILPNLAPNQVKEIRAHVGCNNDRPFTRNELFSLVKSFSASNSLEIFNVIFENRKNCENFDIESAVPLNLPTLDVAWTGACYNASFKNAIMRLARSEEGSSVVIQEIAKILTALESDEPSEIVPTLQHQFLAPLLPSLLLQQLEDQKDSIIWRGLALRFISTNALATSRMISVLYIIAQQNISKLELLFRVLPGIMENGDVNWKFRDHLLLAILSTSNSSDPSVLKKLKLFHQHDPTILLRHINRDSNQNDVFPAQKLQSLYEDLAKTQPPTITRNIPPPPPTITKNIPPPPPLSPSSGHQTAHDRLLSDIKRGSRLRKVSQSREKELPKTLTRALLEGLRGVTTAVHEESTDIDEDKSNSAWKED